MTDPFTTSHLSSRRDGSHEGAHGSLCSCARGGPFGCRARHERFRKSDALRQVFKSVVAKCIAAGLVGGEGFSIDASLIRADAAKKKRLPGDQPIAWPKAEEASRAVREYLPVLDAARSDEESGGGNDSGGGSDAKL